MLEIRKATTADASEIMSVRLSVSENVISRARLQELGISEGSVAKMLDKTHAGHCAVDAGRVVGFSMGDLISGSVFALFVRPEYEGMGLGQRLLRCTVRDLRKAGHSRLTLSTEPRTRAFEFYTRQGWVHTGANEIGEARFVLEK